MAKGKKQSPSSQRWHTGGLGKAKKDLRVRKSSHGKFSSVADLEAHRERQTKKPPKPAKLLTQRQMFRMFHDTKGI